MSRNIVIFPNRNLTGSTDQPYITFSGLTTGTISLVVEDDGSITFDGDTGSLFGISDNKDGLLHSVNDVSGLPIFQVYDDDRLVMGKWDDPTLTISGQTFNIIGGQEHTILYGVTGTTIMGGKNITGTTSNMLYVPQLNIQTIGVGASVNNLGIDANGNVTTGSTGGGGNTFWEYGDGDSNSVIDIYGDHTIVVSSSNTMIAGGQNNSGDTTTHSFFGGGSGNTITESDYSGIIAGINNDVSGFSFRSAIIGGQNNYLGNTQNSVILGGQNIQGTSSDTAYVPSLNISTVNGTAPIFNLGVDSNGFVVTGTTGGGGGITIDPYEDVGNVNTINWDVSGTSTNYEATLTGNTTLNISNVRNGEYGTLILTQDGTGSHTISFGTAPGGHRIVNGGGGGSGGSPTLTAAANAIDILSFTYNGSLLYWTVGNDYT